MRISRFFIIIALGYWISGCGFISGIIGSDPPAVVDTTCDTCPIIKPVVDYSKLDSLALRKILDLNGMQSRNNAEFSEWENDRIVSLHFNNIGQITRLPNDIGTMTQLKNLEMRNTQLGLLPDSLVNLDMLVRLELSGNRLTQLPTEIRLLASLQVLDLSFNRLANFPNSITYLSNLTHLNFSNNKIGIIPNSIGQLKSLVSLRINNNEITAMPGTLQNLPLLDTLDLSSNMLKSVPSTFTFMEMLRYLDFSSNQLTVLPQDLGTFTKLTALYLYNNQLTSLYSDLGNHTLLQELNAAKNGITSLPESIGGLVSLKKLYLENNRIRKLPGSIQNLKQLEVLNLSHNRLDTLPAEMEFMTKLNTLHLLDNNLDSLPSRIVNLRNLKALTIDPTVCAVSPRQKTFILNIATNITSIELCPPAVSVDRKSTKDRSPELTGTVSDANAVVTIQIGLFANVYSAVNNQDGTWTLAQGAIESLADGYHDVHVMVVDGTKQIGDGTVDELYIDATSPAVSVDTMESTDDTPLLTGTIDDTAATVTVYIQGLTFAASVFQDSTWSFNMNNSDTSLLDGWYDVSIVATDSLGNTSQDTTLNELRLDARLMVVTVDVLFTNLARPELKGDVNDISTSVFVNILQGDSLWASVKATNEKNGHWKVPQGAISVDLVEGDWECSILAVGMKPGDSAQDFSALELHIDQTPPIITVNTLSTTDRQPSITGSVNDPEAIVTVTIGNLGEEYTANNRGDGTWLIPRNYINTLAPGKYNVRAKATDRAGNQTLDGTLDELTVVIVTN